MTGRTGLLVGVVVALLGGVQALAGPERPAATVADARPQVVTGSALVADLVGSVAGDRVDVVSLVPLGDDPSSYEPTLRDLGRVARADAAFVGYPLLESPAVDRALRSRLRPGAPHVVLAEESVKHGADPIARVVDRSLDAPWLGLSLVPDPQAPTARAEVAVLAHDGPGDLVAYLTGTFGDADVFTDSRDGFDATDDYRADTLDLPPGAHTHMTWAFTAPGVHRVTLRAQRRDGAGAPATTVATATLVFAVGVDASAAGVRDPVVLRRGHADVSLDAAAGRLLLTGEGISSDGAPATTSGAGDPVPGHRHRHPGAGVALERAVVVVPNRARTEVPDDPGYRFLGPPGASVLQLPQAVLGAHVSGEIDPRLWHDVANTKAYVDLIRDTLTSIDPAGAAGFAARAAEAQTRLDRLDRAVKAMLARIPEPRRHLVTSHDHYAYLARAYGLDAADVLAAQDDAEPSLADRRRVAATVRDLQVPAVFVDASPRADDEPLARIAARAGVAVCALHDDTLDAVVDTYERLMRANARTLARCLSSPAPS